MRRVEKNLEAALSKFPALVAMVLCVWPVWASRSLAEWGTFPLWFRIAAYFLAVVWVLTPRWWSYARCAPADPWDGRAEGSD